MFGKFPEKLLSERRDLGGCRVLHKPGKKGLEFRVLTPGRRHLWLFVSCRVSQHAGSYSELLQPGTAFLGGMGSFSYIGGTPI